MFQKNLFIHKTYFPSNDVVQFKSIGQVQLLFLAEIALLGQESRDKKEKISVF
jgi:hypothetical protein